MNLFVYGTLLFDELVMALSGKHFASAAATLHGYSRHAIVRDGKQEAYPAIQPNPSGIVPGRVLFNVDEPSMRRIDCFESDPPVYDRTEVQVDLDEGKEISAITYVARPGLTPCLMEDWNQDHFARNHLKEYLTTVVPWARRQMG